MKRSICTLLVILAFTQTSIFAQSDARELWLARAQNITGDLLKDGADLSPLQRAVLWAKLAQRWWRDDPKRARAWIADAIEIIDHVPNKESPEERGERLETLQTVFSIVIPLDQQLSKRLLTILNPEKSSPDERNDAAYALINAAAVIADDDPKRAAELGALAFRTGRPSNIDPLFYRLRAQDPKLADSLFAQALGLAKQDSGGMFTNILMYIAFPTERGRPGNIPVPAEPLRIELLQILMTLVTAKPANGENANSNCGAVSWLAPLFGEFERLLPQQWPILRQAINTCQAASPQIKQQINWNSDQRLDTVESLLSVAADAKDIRPRTDYAYRAAALAEENMEYERALKILDEMSDEQRQLMGESWTSARWDWAADGAVEHYKKGRLREMNLILDTTPLDLQPLAKAAFIERLPEKLTESAPIVQILNDTIKGLRRSGIPEGDKSNWYLDLLKPTVKYQLVDANSVLKDAVASLNKVKDSPKLNLFETFSIVGPPLLEMDEFVVKDALASVTDVQIRALLRLSLLKSTLQRVKTN